MMLDMNHHIFTVSACRRNKPVRLFLLRGLAGLLLIPAVLGCKWLQVEVSPPQSHIDDLAKRYKIQKNVKYGKDPLHTFDLYLPESEFGNPSEIVVIVHGGAWYAGDKAWLDPTVDSLMKARKNLAIVNMNYRLLPGPGKTRLLTNQLNDIDSCVNFVLRKAEDYNIRKRVVLAGVSAGGHLSLMYAYTRKDVAAVVGISAYTELSDRLFMDRELRNNVVYLVGANYGDSLQLFKDASPLYIAGPEVPPTVLVYGGQDQRVTHQQGRLLAAKLSSFNVPNSYVLLGGEDHNVSVAYVANAILDVYGTKKYVLGP